MKEVLSTIAKFTIDSKKLDESLKPLKKYLETFGLQIVPIENKPIQLEPTRGIKGM